jgi:hypothetical protein
MFHSEWNKPLSRKRLRCLLGASKRFTGNITRTHQFCAGGSSGTEAENIVDLAAA